MSEPDATITTATSVNVETGDEREDGVISEPSRWVANILWILVVLVLCVAVLALTGTVVMLAFIPAEPKAAVDAATIVALMGTVLASLVGFYSARQGR